MPLDLTVSEMRVGEQRLFCGIVRDVTDRLAAEDALRRRRKRCCARTSSSRSTASSCSTRAAASSR